MGLKIHDFCAVRIRCLVIVEIICLIFFAAGCTGKTVEGVKEDFPFVYTSVLILRGDWQRDSSAV